MIATWHGPDAPTDEQWEAFLKLLQAADLTVARGLVFTEGGAPSAAQRRALAAVVGVKQVPIAVLSDQSAIRFIASMLAMMTKRIRSFSTADVRQACAHLALTPEETRQAEAFVAEMKARSRRMMSAGSMG